MKGILCFGDSNTYGYIPDGSGRYERNVRYTCVLEKLLGSEYYVIEEGLCGRTTVYEDPTRYCRKAVDYIEPCLQSHLPLHCIVLMLGTNDCKSIFNADAREIREGMEAVIKIIRSNTDTPIMLVSPILLGNEIWKPEFDPDFDAMSLEVSKALADEYKNLAAETGCLFLNAAEFAEASPVDQEHLLAEGHLSLAQAIAEIIKKI